MAKANFTPVDHYKHITDGILASLAVGVKPWARPWATKGGTHTLDSGLPFNVSSGRNYRGLNVPMLWGATASRGYGRHAWLSFRQAHEGGGNVRKGEKATLVFFFKFLEKQSITESGEHKAFRIPLIRAYPVFNVDQCEGVTLPQRAAPEPTQSSGALGPVSPVLDRLCLDGGLHFDGDAAFYTPSRDAVYMPTVEAFETTDRFYATLLHECGHATGAKSRLARDFSGRFGGEAYAFEELVAELTSAFSQAVLGIRADIENHANYIASWQKVLTADKWAFAKACSLAQAAADLLLGHKAGGELQEEQPQEPIAA